MNILDQNAPPPALRQNAGKTLLAWLRKGLARNPRPKEASTILRSELPVSNDAVTRLLLSELGHRHR